jgi:hypothetical protein
MTQGLETGESKSVLWNGFYGDHRMGRDEIERAFAENSKHLKTRKNGNVLYHEILAFSMGHRVQGEALERAVTDIGQEYLRYRAPNQMAFGVMHFNTDHVHLHLMISANDVGKRERVRLSKAEFAEVQKAVEAFVIARYPELAQTQVYGREQSPERLKTQADEQAMKATTGKASRKEALKTKLHQIFEQATTPSELTRLAEQIGARFYERGKSIGVIVRDPDGTERRHRLATLGLETHYAVTKSRLSQRAGEKKKPQAHNQEQEMKPAEQRSVPPTGGATKQSPAPAPFEQVEELAKSALEYPVTYIDDILKEARELDQGDGQGRAGNAKPSKRREDDLER